MALPSPFATKIQDQNEILSLSINVKYTFRPLTIADQELISDQRDAIFLEMGMAPVDIAAARNYYMPWLKELLEKGNYKGYAIVEQSTQRCIGGGAIWIGIGDPLPMVPSSDLRRATVTNIFIEKEHRRQGLARCLVEKLIAMAKEDGHQVLELQSSDAGRHLYESLGFTDIHEYRMVVAENIKR